MRLCRFEDADGDICDRRRWHLGRHHLCCGETVSRILKRKETAIRLSIELGGPAVTLGTSTRQPPRCNAAQHCFEQTDGVVEAGQRCRCGERELRYRAGPFPSLWYMAAGSPVEVSS